MKKLAITLCLLFIVILKLYSVPSSPELIKFIQNDGTRLNMYQFGDEFIHWSETVDGYTILNDGNNLYYYAEKDRNGNLKRSDFQSHNIDERTPNEKAFLRSLEKNIRFSKKQTEQFKKIIYQRSRDGNFPTTGTNNLLMILANYNDTNINFSQTNFDNYMNQSNYNGTGSFRDYYIECSYGQLTVNTTVTNWVTVSNTHDYYGQNDGSGDDLHPRELVYEAIQLVDASINFANFDNDNNNIVDGIAVIHQGTGEETSGNANDIWSHSWTLSGLYTSTQRTFDGVLVDDYTIQPEMSGSTMNSIGVMCHEFGHNMGAPDFYDTDYGVGGQYDGTGEWDIMGSGAYNGTPSGSKPSHHNPFTKWKYYNWILPSEINSALSVSMNNSLNNTDFYYYTTTTPNEYFLLENRQQIGFDSGVPGHGLIIYHVDENYINAHYLSNDINTTSHQGFYPKAANGTINSSGCPFPGASNNTSFTDNTAPNSQSYANNDTNKPVTNISESSNIIYFDFMGGANRIDVALVLDRSGSMSGNKISQAKNAASQFAGLLNVGDEVAICSYASGASSQFDITEITGQQTIFDVLSAISTISSGGMTSIGAGMEEGRDQLANVSVENYPQGMLLLSDGRENTSPMVADILPTIPTETDIYTIGFGSGCDEDLMKNIATTTDGFYRFAYNDGSNINAIVNEIYYTLTGQQLLAWFWGQLSGGKEIVEHEVVLDSLCSQTTFNLMWENSASDLDFVLVDPNNITINPDSAAADSSINFQSYSTQEFYKINDPQYGNWTMRVIGDTIPNPPENYDLTVSGFSGIEMQVAFDQDEYITGQPIIVTAELTSEGNPITGADSVSAEVENPNYVTETILLYDDGAHNDVNANDGIYGNAYTNATIGGSYTFTVSARGTATVGGQFTRIASRSTFVSGPTIYQTTLDEGFNMVAVPGNPSPAYPDSIFGDDIDPFYMYTNNSNIWWWSEINSSYMLPDEIENGYGYWVKAWEDNTIVDANVAPVTMPVTINLSNNANYYLMQHGYHMLGNPYNSSIDFGPDNFSLDPAIVQNIYVWSCINNCYEVHPFDGSYSIEPWKAFWIQTSQNDQNLTMNLSNKEELMFQNNNKKDDITNWSIQFEVEVEGLMDVSNYAGIHENASNTWDVMDAIEIPNPNSDFVSFYFPHDDWGQYSADYTKDIRNPELNNSDWDIIVKSTESGEASITWDVPAEVPQDYKLKLIDHSNNTEINLRNESEYVFNAAAYDEYEFTFKIVPFAVDPGSELPNSFDISANYPNPFTQNTEISYQLPQEAEVEIAIYNIKGQKINELTKERQEPGYYNTSWNGLNEKGKRVNSGIYLYRIKATNNKDHKFEKYKKMILIR